ncbi:MAG: serine/threonine protein kinase [Muribaculaceae bacterium]|nr:serine/threonine protein kinase [Muribaculaceae bacterium]
MKETDTSSSTSTSGIVDEDFTEVGGTFTNIEEIYRSTVNVIYRAMRYGRWWALKCLNPEVAGTTAYQERLRKEFEIHVKLQHVGIVSAVGLESVESVGRCIVMEWIDGVTLSDYLADDSRPVAERRRILDEILEAVNFCHKADIVHRDLKPKNILITNNGSHVKLIDFGLADTNSHLYFKQPAGTRRYMSPEQSSTATPDPRNDIYSIGVIMRDMNLGGGYSRIADKALLPIDKRYAGIDEIRHDLRRIESNRRNLKRLVAFLMAAAVVGLSTFFITKATMKQPLAEMVNSADLDKTKIDFAKREKALRDSFETQKAITESKLMDATSSLEQLNSDIVARDQAEVVHKMAVEKAKTDGYKAIDRAAADLGITTAVTQIESFTVADYDRLNEIHTNVCRKLTVAKNAYAKSIEHSFSSVEYADICKCLDNYFDRNYYSQTSRKLRELKERKNTSQTTSRAKEEVRNKIDGYWNFFDAPTAEKHSRDLMEQYIEHKKIPQDSVNAFRTTISDYIAKKKQEYSKIMNK